MHYIYLTKLALGVLLYIAFVLFIGFRVNRWMQSVQRKLDRQIAFRMFIRKVNGNRISRC